MSKRRLIDTNLIIRHLVQDHERHAEIAGALFDACDRGELRLVMLPEVLAECVFVLESFYKHARGNIAVVLSGLIGSPGIEIHGLDEHLDALGRYAAGKLHFVDCLLAATAARRAVSVATFDAGFKKFSDVVVELG
jgi:predicted nucleic acid-binding protein